MHAADWEVLARLYGEEVEMQWEGGKLRVDGHKRSRIDRRDGWQVVSMGWL